MADQGEAHAEALRIEALRQFLLAHPFDSAEEASEGIFRYEEAVKDTTKDWCERCQCGVVEFCPGYYCDQGEGCRHPTDNHD